MLLVLLLQLTVYWGVGLRQEPEVFFKIYLALWLSSQSATGIGLSISAICKSLIETTAFAPPTAMLNTLFSGLYCNSGTMPVYLSWLQWLQPMRYSMEALC